MTKSRDSMPYDFDAAHYPTPNLRQPGVVVASAEQERRKELASYFANQGFDVWSAGSTSELLDTLVGHAGRVDLLLLDADLPELAYRGFLRRLKAVWPELSCVLLVEEVNFIPRLLSAVAAVVPKSIAPGDLAKRLWETVASLEWVKG